MTHYVVATIKSWNIKAYDQHHGNLPGQWHLIDSPEQLTLEKLRAIAPEYVFFPHWSWIVPESILSEFNCICFHMTDLPYGRGGSPLQNLIANGHKTTKLSVLKMTNELDAGPIYLKKELDLSGSAQDIFERSALLTWQAIEEMVLTKPTAIDQNGEVTEFIRRKPEQSAIDWEQELVTLYDHIRMLDAESYPYAFTELADKLLQFRQVKINENGDLIAQVTISKNRSNTP